MKMRLLAATSGVAVATTLAASAPALYGSAARITPRGVDGVKLGGSYQNLRRQRLVSKIRPGCELGGPNARAASLRSPLAGAVNLTLRSPRRVAQITVTGGARARGVGIGATLADVKAAYPKAMEDHGTEEAFGITLVKIPKSGGGRLQFAVDVSSGKVSSIGIPRLAFCE